MVVPLDQCGRQTSSRQRATVQVPHDVTDGSAMIVDQKPCSFAVAIFGEASQVKFVDMLHGESVDVSRGVEPMVDRGNMYVVDVEQQSASGPLCDFRQKLDLGHRGRAKGDVCRRILQQHFHPKNVLDLVHMGADMAQRNLVVGQGQEIVEEDAVVSRPRKMLGKEGRLIDRNDALQASEVLTVERRRAPDGEASAVILKWIVRSDTPETVVRGAAATHIILGVNFEKIELARLPENISGMFGLEPGASGIGGHDHTVGLR